MNWRFEWKPQDFWVGLYTEVRRDEEKAYIERHVWICLLPMVPLHLWWRRLRPFADLAKALREGKLDSAQLSPWDAAALALHMGAETCSDRYGGVRIIERPGRSDSPP